MCGFVGAVSTQVLSEIDLSWVGLGTDRLVPRGPDDEGLWASSNSRCTLGHRRLSVIDLSSGGHQPMHSSDGRHHLVFNGEIFNFPALKIELAGFGYEFASTSDSEVLLKSFDHWGTDCLRHLNGQFAFAIINERDGTVFLARDRAGEKPLYYTLLDSGTFIFGSELKALIEHPEVVREIAAEDLSYFLIKGYFETENSIIESIKRLPPAHFLKINLHDGEQILKRFWTLPEKLETESSTEDLSLELEVLLSTSIERQYQADVPVGILLSGGLDSSIIATLAARGRSNMNTYTAIFPEAPELDESTHAKLISNSISSNHTECEVRRPSLELLEFLGSNFDEPILDASLIPTYLLAQEVRKSCVVTLGGDGADELFGGYKHYSRALSMQKWGNALPAPVRILIAESGQRLFPFGVPGNAWFRLLAGNLSYMEAQPDRMFDRKNAMHLFSRFDEAQLSRVNRNTEPKREFDPIDHLLRQDFANYLPNDILIKLDRYSMLTSLEMRSPFLDKDVIEFAFERVPSHFKVDGEQKKILLNDLGKRILPSSFEFGRKMGFVPPVIQWGQLPEWQKFMEGFLLSPQQVLFDKRTLSRYFHLAKKRPLLLERLLTLTLLEIWRRKYSAKLIGS